MSLSTFITNLQNSDDRRKFRWLVGLTAITVVVLVGGWLMVFESEVTTNPTLVRKEDQPGFLEKIAMTSKGVTEVLRRKTANTIHFFSNKFSKTNTIEVNIEDKHEEPSTKSETNSNNQTP